MLYFALVHTEGIGVYLRNPPELLLVVGHLLYSDGSLILGSCVQLLLRLQVNDVVVTYFELLGLRPKVEVERDIHVGEVGLVAEPLRIQKLIELVLLPNYFRSYFEQLGNVVLGFGFESHKLAFPDMLHIFIVGEFLSIEGTVGAGALQHQVQQLGFEYSVDVLCRLPLLVSTQRALALQSFYLGFAEESLTILAFHWVVHYPKTDLADECLDSFALNIADEGVRVDVYSFSFLDFLH